MNNLYKCEWFELGMVLYRERSCGHTETKTVETFDTYEEALRRKQELQKENPEIEYFIDGWINKDEPEDIWWEGQNEKNN